MDAIDEWKDETDPRPEDMARLAQTNDNDATVVGRDSDARERHHAKDHAGEKVPVHAGLIGRSPRIALAGGRGNGLSDGAAPPREAQAYSSIWLSHVCMSK
jgi:hypothetical protein